MASTTAPSYSKIESGVILRIGSADVTTSPGETMRGVVRGEEAIAYKIEEDLYGLRTDETGWEHYRYRFTYRRHGHTLSVTWNCGTGYGEPKGHDGLASAFLDAQSVNDYDSLAQFMDDYGYDWETDRKQGERAYNACRRMAERLERFFENDAERERWELALSDR